MIVCGNILVFDKFFLLPSAVHRVMNHLNESSHEIFFFLDDDWHWHTIYTTLDDLWRELTGQIDRCLGLVGDFTWVSLTIAPLSALFWVEKVFFRILLSWFLQNFEARGRAKMASHASGVGVKLKIAENTFPAWIYRLKWKLNFETGIWVTFPVVTTLMDSTPAASASPLLFGLCFG